MRGFMDIDVIKSSVLSSLYNYNTFSDPGAQDVFERPGYGIGALPGPDHV
jgi:hypothetical protein